MSACSTQLLVELAASEVKILLCGAQSFIYHVLLSAAILLVFVPVRLEVQPRPIKLILRIGPVYRYLIGI